MCEVIGDFYAVFHTGQLSVSLRIASPACDAAEQKQLVVKLNITLDQPYIWQVEYSLVDADVAIAVEVGLGSRPLHNYLCSMVYLGKWQNTSRVVIVSVTEYHSIYCGQVYTESFCILHNSVSLSCIEQELMILSLNIDAESMLCDTVFITAGVLYQGYNSHQ